MRLLKGDFNQETVFAEDPLEMAFQWQSQGATRLHIVDLDGAAIGEPQNLEIIERICSNLFIPIQVGGGIRGMESVEKLLKLGADRVVMGTAAIFDRDLIRKVCRRFCQSVVIAIDARDGFVATHGWQETTELSATRVALDMVDLGVRRFLYTDIGRDGTMTEPNFASIFELIDTTRFPIIASGGICSILHVKLLKKLGVEGAVIGRALYTGDIDLAQALAAVES